VAPRQEAPHPSGTTSDERLYGMLAHLGFFFFPVVGAALAFALTADKPHAKKCAAQAATLQLLTYGSVFLYPIAIVVLLVVAPRQTKPDEGLLQLLMVLPWLVMGLAFLLGTLFTIWGAVQANDGKVWRVPLVGWLVARITSS
jgi:uncharacterized Tic20 family protein